MALNKVKTTGNMYNFLNDHPSKDSNRGYTWNTVKGKCPHNCSYCYCKRWGEQSELHFDEKELKTDLGKGNFIFVGSSCDMWAESMFPIWIFRTLDYCKKFNNRYLFQSKNPARIYRMRSQLPVDIVLGTTMESNWDHPEAHGRSILAGQPTILRRVDAIKEIRKLGYPVMITIEPIMRFDLRTFSEMIFDINPQWVNIGANTNTKVKLPEPKSEEIRDLISTLSEFTKVKIKKNLNRLLEV